MKLKISLLAILAATLVTPTLSFAHGQDRDHMKARFYGRALQTGLTYSVHGYGNNFRHVKPHHQAHHRDNRADYLDRKGDRIDRRLDRKGKRINNKLDRAAYEAWRQGDYRKARQLDRKGDKIERYYDREGDRINRKLDRRANGARSHNRERNHHNS